MTTIENKDKNKDGDKNRNRNKTKLPANTSLAVEATNLRKSTAFTTTKPVDYAANTETANIEIFAMKTASRTKVATHLAVASAMVTALVLLPELAMAVSKFDIDAGIEAATTPLIAGISNHWGKAVLLTGCGGAIIGEGDARQRATRAAIASVAAGGTVLALLAMLT